MKRINSAYRRRVRESVCNRFDGRCAYCNARIGLKAGTIDHYMPQALGGTNARGNLRWCCRGCNTLKADMHPDEWVQRQPAPVAEKSPAALKTALLQMVAQRSRERAAT